MKKLLGLALVALPLILLSFKPAYNIDDVVAAIKAGNASGLAKYFDERVDISLPDKSDTYSRTQAEMIIRDFFNNKGVISFEVKHKGEQGGAQFCVGELKTKQGTYRTHLFMRQRGDRQLLQEIRFQAVQ
jgi:malate synthase